MGVLSGSLLQAEAYPGRYYCFPNQGSLSLQTIWYCREHVLLLSQLILTELSVIWATCYIFHISIVGNFFWRYLKGLHYTACNTNFKQRQLFLQQKTIFKHSSVLTVKQKVAFKCFSEAEFSSSETAKKKQHTPTQSNVKPLFSGIVISEKQES